MPFYAVIAGRLIRVELNRCAVIGDEDGSPGGPSFCVGASVGTVDRLATHFTRSPDTLDARSETELRAIFLDVVTTRQVSRSTLMVYRSGIRFL